MSFGILTKVPKTVARQIPPKATCERPSPINEKRLRTRVTPSREEQSEMRTPTMKAYRTNGKLKYVAKVSIIFFYVSKKGCAAASDVQHMACVFECGVCIV